MSSIHNRPYLIPLVGEKGVDSTDTLRACLEALAAAAIEALDALDAAQADMEPDCDAEAEPDEASRQPATLVADWLPALDLTPKRGTYPANVIAFPRRLRTVQVTA